jgi:hypothetical protein
MLSLTRTRKKKPVVIGSRNTELFVQTVYYKDNPRAVWNMLLILLMVAIAFVSVIFMDTLWAILLIIGLFSLPLYASISGKSWFSFNATHDKPLIFEPDALQLGDEYFDIHALENLYCYVDGFYGLRIAGIPGQTQNEYLLSLMAGARNSSYGDKNEIRFTYGGKQYACRFLLGSGTAWMALYEILAAWRQQGKAVDLKEAIPYEGVLMIIQNAAQYYNR